MPRHRGIRRRRPVQSRGRVVLTIIAILGVAALVGTHSAGAAFARSTANGPSALATATAFPCLDTAALDSPDFFYAFQEVNGTTAVDGSTSANTGTLQTGVTRVAGSCQVNASPYVTLNGSTGQVTTTTARGGPLSSSVETWFRTTTTTGGKLLGFGDSRSGLSSAGSTDRNLYMGNDGHIYFGTYGLLIAALSKSVISTPLAYNDGAWHHVVGTIGLLGPKIYIDGVVVASSTALSLGSLSITGYWRVGDDNLSGWSSAPTSTFFAGSMDDTAAYGFALTGAQVLAHYTRGH